MRIGVFDSGLGGLSVLRVLLRVLPHAEFLYFGDTANLPYGSKSPARIQKLTLEGTTLLARQGIDLLVIACHTASAWAADYVRSQLPIPVFDMVGPTERVLHRSSQTGSIAVLGTRAMIQSEVYQKSLREGGVRPILPLACPLFVPLVEEGIVEGPVAIAALHYHLQALEGLEKATVVLGCTHYPALLPLMQRLYPQIQEWIDPASSVASEVADLVKPALPTQEQGAQAESAWRARLQQVIVSEDAPHFGLMSSLFLENPIQPIDLRRLDKGRVESVCLLREILTEAVSDAANGFNPLELRT